MRNRPALLARLAAATAALCLLTVPWAGAAPVAPTSGEREARPLDADGGWPAAPTPWDGRPRREPAAGNARQADLVPRLLRRLPATVRSGLARQPDTGRPAYPGAVVLAARHGIVAAHEAYGEALRYADADGTLLPRDQRIPMRRDTIFDLASVSKLFTALAVMQLVEAGSVRLDAPVARYLPAFASNGKGDVTVRHLLTHTGGLPAWLPLYADHDTPAARIRAVLTVEPVQQHRTAPAR